MEIGILIADDHQIIRDGLRALIERQPDMKLLGEASDGDMIIELVKKHHPNIVIMDLVMPNLNGIEATRRIVSEFPDVKVIALSMHSDKQFVMEMLRAGAAGYLIKESAFEELVIAIRSVLKNRQYLSPEVTGMVINESLHQPVADETVVSPVLSPREREVLQLLAEGNNVKGIALRLSISPKTVETHRRQIMNKLDIHNLPQLTKYAIREGLTTL